MSTIARIRRYPLPRRPRVPKPQRRFEGGEITVIFRRPDYIKSVQAQTVDREAYARALSWIQGCQCEFTGTAPMSHFDVKDTLRLFAERIRKPLTAIFTFAEQDDRDAIHFHLTMRRESKIITPHHSPKQRIP
jgi:hypothetical protein